MFFEQTRPVINFLVTMSTQMLTFRLQWLNVCLTVKTGENFMARITVEDCLENVDNRFELVILASKRARQLAITAAEPMVPVENDKPTVLALREIAEGLVTNKTITDSGNTESEEQAALLAMIPTVAETASVETTSEAAASFLAPKPVSLVEALATDNPLLSAETAEPQTTSVDPAPAADLNTPHETNDSNPQSTETGDNQDEA